MKRFVRVVAGLAVTAVALGSMGGVAGAVPGPNAKKAFPVQCTSGNLSGQTLTVAGTKTVYKADGTRLRLTALRVEFGGKVKDKQFGKTQGNLTCGGSEITPEGAFTFFATLTEA